MYLTGSRLEFGFIFVPEKYRVTSYIATNFDELNRFY
jgi:hypothetical protein